MRNKIYHCNDAVLFASSYNVSGEVVNWAEGQVTNVYHSWGHIRYCIRDMSTNKVHNLIRPEEVKPWPKDRDNRAN